jgi:hypothetical protein
MREPWFVRVAGGAIFLSYALVLFHHTSRSVGGSDSSGYLNAARLFASGHVTEPIRGLERLGLPPDFAPVFVPLGYTTARQPGRMAPSYPPGYPLHLALAGKLGGWKTAPFLVTPIAGLTCLVLMYLIGRELALPPLFAFAGSAILAFAPTFVFLALQPMSDVLATAWALGAVFAAYRARRSPGWSVIAGAAFAIGVLVRPMNALLLPALAFVLPLRRRELALFALGGAPFAAFLLLYDHAAFGSAWRTGYGGLLAGALAWSNFPPRVQHYLLWLVRTMTFVPLAGWLAVIADRRVAARDRAALIAWLGAFLLFYSFYVVYDAWWYTRFLLSGLPAAILGALLVTRDLLLRSERSSRNGWRSWRGALAFLLFAFVLVVEIRFIDRNRLHKIYKGERLYPQACEMARGRVPGNGIVASMQMSGALHYYTPLDYAMWNWLLPDRFAELRAATESQGRRWYALLAPFEVQEVWKNLPGDWRTIDRTGDVVLWELPPASR